MQALNAKGRRAREDVDLINELRAFPSRFIRYTRLTPTMYDELLSLVTPVILAQNTVCSNVPVEDRLLLTLRFLGTGRSFSDFAFEFFRDERYISMIIFETCAAIIFALKDIIMLPKTEEEWVKVANKFEARWGFPNCLGAIDGKFINLNKPVDAFEAEYKNYKGQHSLILLALVDADGQLMMTTVGEKGNAGDDTALRRSRFGELLYSGKLNVPAPRKVGNHLLPPVFIGDAGFRQNQLLLTPYVGKDLSDDQLMLNHCISTTRQVVGEVFEKMASKFGALKTIFRLQPEKVKLVVGAICVLQNYSNRPKVTNPKLPNYQRDNTIICDKSNIRATYTKYFNRKSIERPNA